MELAPSWYGSCEAHADLSWLGLCGKNTSSFARLVYVFFLYVLALIYRPLLLQIDLDNRLQYIQLNVRTALYAKDFWMQQMYNNSNDVWWVVKVSLQFIKCWLHLLYVARNIVQQQYLGEYLLTLQAINANREMQELLAGNIGSMVVGVAAPAA